MARIFPILAGMALVLSCLAISLQAGECTQYTDTFDQTDLSRNNHSGLWYSFSTKSLTSLSGIVPVSSPSVIYADQLTPLKYGKVTLRPSGTIETIDDTKSFDLDSLYFACASSTFRFGFAAPVPCTLTAWGYDVNNEQVSVVSASYTTDGLVKGKMLKYTFNGFKKMKNVTIGIGDPGFDTITDLVLDNVTHCNYG